MANDLLTRAQAKLDKTKPTIKSYSTTRWSGAATMCKSVLANKDLIGTVLSGQKMCERKNKELDFSPS